MAKCVGHHCAQIGSVRMPWGAYYCRAHFKIWQERKRAAREAERFAADWERDPINGPLSALASNAHRWTPEEWQHQLDTFCRTTADARPGRGVLA